MSAAAGNTRGGVRISARADFAAYDALHPRLREVVRRAPYDLATRQWAASLPRGVEAARRDLIARLVAMQARLALATYGSDHPQAAASPTPVAPAWARPARDASPHTPKRPKGGRDAARR